MKLGYRIDYGQPFDKKYPMPARRSRLPWMVCGALLLFALLTNLYWPEGRTMLAEFLVPGDAAVTTAAFSDMVADVRAGEEVSDAVAAFCREILDDGLASD